MSDADFSVPAFLSGVDPRTGDAEVLEALARKIEVARRLHESYDATLGRPASATLLDPAWLPALGAAFLDAAERMRDLKWLNTALKLQDGVLREPSFAGDAALEARIRRMLEQPLP
jgi:hypothetical protein